EMVVVYSLVRPLHASVRASRPGAPRAAPLPSIRATPVAEPERPGVAPAAGAHQGCLRRAPDSLPTRRAAPRPAVVAAHGVGRRPPPRTAAGAPRDGAPALGRPSPA